MVEIRDSHRDLLEGTVVATFVTMLPNGAPHATPTWVDYDGEFVLVNTVEGRRKERNVRADPTVAVCLVDPENTSRYLSVTGVVEERTTEGAVEHIHELARRYRGVEEYPYLEEDPGDRLLLKVRPLLVLTNAYRERSDELGFSTGAD